MQIGLDKMKEFYIRCTVVTFCLIILSRFFQFTVHSQTTNHFENPKYSLSSTEPSVLVYEFINETTRFNKKTGDLEYFIQYKQKESYAGETYSGSWKKRENLWK